MDNFCDSRRRYLSALQYFGYTRCDRIAVVIGGGEKLFDKYCAVAANGDEIGKCAPNVDTDTQFSIRTRVSAHYRGFLKRLVIYLRRSNLRDPLVRMFERRASQTSVTYPTEGSYGPPIKDRWERIHQLKRARGPSALLHPS